MLASVHRFSLSQIARCTPGDFNAIVLERLRITVDPSCSRHADLAAHPERRQNAMGRERINGERGVASS
ncbi:MAG: hypothetical protein ACKOCK_05270, partial [Chloroflexota bacterium]